MSSLVTGVAGFVGSHLAEKLIEKGGSVLGIDRFTDYYPKATKVSNLSTLKKKAAFRLIEGDINSLDLRKLIGSVEHVYHLAAQPGVRPSWGTSFDRYLMDNVLATQRLLEACKGADIKKFVYASSSSIYGDAERLPTPEETTPKPVSPYGATKLAAEHLCHLYHRNFGVPTVALRYFTVYGPRQRPDMAFNIFISKVSRGEPLEIYGDGSQSRDFSFVDDVAEATILASEAAAGSVYNVGSGFAYPLWESIALIEKLVGNEARISYKERAAGDVVKTSADISKIRKELGYGPRVSLRDGLDRQVRWQLG